MPARQEYYGSKTATTTSAEQGFGFPARKLSVINDGAVSVHIDLVNGTATTADPEVKAGEEYSPPVWDRHEGPTKLAYVSASSTAAIRIYAYE